MPNLSSRTIFGVYAISLSVALLLTAGILYMRLVPREFQVSAPLAPPGTVEFSIDAATLQPNKLIRGWTLTLQGWALVPGKAITSFAVSVVLKTKNGVFYRLPAKVHLRPDVSATRQSEGLNYDASGFTVKALLSRRLHGKGPFAVYLLYNSNNENVLVNTGVTL